MKEQILRDLAALDGKIGLYVKNLVTGEEIAYNADDSYNPASTIKLAVLAEVYRQVSLGNASLQDTIRVRDSDKCGGCGALKSFDGEPEVTIGTLCRLMITISDNTATNVLIRHFGPEKLSAGFRTFGLEKTTVRRCFYDTESERRGIHNEIVPREMGQLLEQFYNGAFISKEVSDEILSIMLNQQINHKLERLPGDMEYAHKTGEQSGVTNDIAIVYAPQPFIFCFYANEADIHQCNDFIRNATWLLAGGEALGK